MGAPKWLQNRTLKTRPDRPDDPPLPLAELAEKGRQGGVKRSRGGVRGAAKGGSTGPTLYDKLEEYRAYSHPNPEVERKARELYDIWRQGASQDEFRPFELLPVNDPYGTMTMREHWYVLAKALLYDGSRTVGCVAS